MFMNTLHDCKSILVSSVLLLTLPGLSLLGQDEGGGGSSPAEAAVTSGGVSQPAEAASGSTESNPVVTLVRSGVDWGLAKTVNVSEVVTIATAGGTLAKLTETAGKIASGSLTTKDLVTLIDVGLKIDAATGTAEGVKDGDYDLTTVTTLVVQGGISADFTVEDLQTTASGVKVGTYDLTTVSTLMTQGISIDDVQTTAAGVKVGTYDLTTVTTLITQGISIEDVQTTAADVKVGTYDLADVVSLIDSGFTATQAASAAEGVKTGDITLENIADLADAGLTPAEIDAAAGGSETSLNTTLLLSTKALTNNNELFVATTEVINSVSTQFAGFQTALEGAVTVADSILTNKTITSGDDLPTPINAASFAGNGYTTELIRLLAKYGAIGPKGDDVANAVLGSNYAAFSGSQSLSSLLQSSTAGYLSSLADLGARTFAEEDSGSSVLNIPLSNVTLGAGANITFSAGASIDVSDMLSKATSSADRKIGIIGAAKDLTFAGDATFTNTNDVEDHALAIGAADDVYFRSEWSTANSADYADPDPITVKYTGSNLGIGSYDTMRLVNVNLETGGNLALGTLDELHIGLTDAHSSTFSVGTGGKNSDPDNVYLYANNLIQVNGLQFSGRLDDVYMEAITINLKDVAFPSTADVMLRSRDGTVNFGTYSSPIPGSVNLTEVSHGGTILDSSNVSGIPGRINSSLTLPNGTSAIKIRQQN